MRDVSCFVFCIWEFLLSRDIFILLLFCFNGIICPECTPPLTPQIWGQMQSIYLYIIMVITDVFILGFYRDLYTLCRFSMLPCKYVDLLILDWQMITYCNTASLIHQSGCWTNEKNPSVFLFASNT